MVVPASVRSRYAMRMRMRLSGIKRLTYGHHYNSYRGLEKAIIRFSSPLAQSFCWGLDDDAVAVTV